jgi:hypothetical protein
MEHLVSRDEIKRIRKELKEKGKESGFYTNGCFDLHSWQGM